MNAPLKSADFTNFSLKFAGLVFLFFSGCVHLTVSIFPTKWSHSLHFLQSYESFHDEWHLNVLEPEHLKLEV